MQIKKSSLSSYTRNHKSPFVYSDLYRRWKAARVAGNDGYAEHVAREHAQHFGYALPRKGY